MTDLIYFDTHAHLDDEQFDGDREGVISRARSAGVASIVTVGVTAASSEACVQLARRRPGIHAAVGIQPNYCAEAAPGDWDRVCKLAEAAQAAAVGETGLDRYWDHAPLPLQQDYFDRHLRLSQQLGLPVIIHLRDAGAEILAMLSEARRRGPLAGVMHAFTGDAALADHCLALGLHISFAGMVTFKKSAPLRDIAAAIPDDRILIETDSPYLAPHPHRGRRPNEPALLVHTASCLAEVRGVDVQRLARLTAANARRLFSIAS